MSATRRRNRNPSEEQRPPLDFEQTIDDASEDVEPLDAEDDEEEEDEDYFGMPPIIAPWGALH